MRVDDGLAGDPLTFLAGSRRSPSTASSTCRWVIRASSDVGDDSGLGVRATADRQRDQRPAPASRAVSTGAVRRVETH